MGSFRSFLYQLGKLLGDLNAVNKGKTGKRIARRKTGKATGKAFRKIFK